MAASNQATQPQFATAVVTVHELLSKIENLCERPYWTPDRKERIADLARQAKVLLENPSSL